jgi:hypothetical protein
MVITSDGTRQSYGKVKRRKKKQMAINKKCNEDSSTESNFNYLTCNMLNQYGNTFTKVVIINNKEKKVITY